MNRGAVIVGGVFLALLMAGLLLASTRGTGVATLGPDRPLNTDAREGSVRGGVGSGRAVFVGGGFHGGK